MWRSVMSASPDQTERRFVLQHVRVRRWGEVGRLGALGLAVSLAVAACTAAGDEVALRRVEAGSTTSTTASSATPNEVQIGLGRVSEPVAAELTTPVATQGPAAAAAGPSSVGAASPSTSAAAVPTVPAPAAPRSTVAATPPPARTGQFTIEPYRGLGTWVDVFDWTEDFTGGNPVIGPEHMQAMADVGVQTLYIQASRWDRDTEVMERPRLLAIIDAAHQAGMDVVGWYLPALVDPADDLRKMIAVSKLPIEGLGVDIEALNVKDPAERSRRMVELSRQLRAALPNEVLSGIVLPPVVMEEINRNYWPGFPWAELAPIYDVWQPMSYWTNRSASSKWRDGYLYTAENIDRMRAHLGQPDALVHSIGGIADKTTVDDINGMVRASQERGAIGGSLYDWRTTGAHLWEAQQPFRK